MCLTICLIYFDKNNINGALREENLHWNLEKTLKKVTIHLAFIKSG
jgi:hypothetical protein